MYIGNSVSGKLHTENCVSLPREKHQLIFENLNDAIELGFEICSLCLSSQNIVVKERRSCFRCKEWKSECLYLDRNGFCNKNTVNNTETYPDYDIVDTEICTPRRDKEYETGMKSQYAQSILSIYDIVDTDLHINRLSELINELEELNGYVSERIKTLKLDNRENKKYTLKQLHQAWGAGKASAEKS
jgi:hypothetical protein